MTDKRSPLILAIDLGTSSVRALLVDLQLNIVTQCAAGLKLDEPRDGWVQQEAEPVVQAAFAAIRGALDRRPDASGQVSGLCFSNAVSSLLPLDGQLKPLGPALTWADSRAFAEAAAVKEEHGGELYRRTGCPLHATYWLPKLLWTRRHAPELFSSAHLWVTLKDYVVLRLTGSLAIDASNAAATGLMNLERGVWDDLPLSLAGISPDQLPPIMPTTAILPRFTDAAAQELGLRPDLPLVLGAGDGVLSTLGTGVVRPGQSTTMIGSSGAARVVATGPGGRDRLCRTWSYPLADGLWVLGGAENSGGLVVEWVMSMIYRDIVGAASASAEAYAALMADAAQAGPGADGLLFLPYLFGERAPIWNEDARGAFIGLSARHTRAHLARAALEGTIYALYTVLEALEEQAGPIREVRVSGGYVRSPLWLQIQADLFGQRLLLPANFEGSALGAAILGQYALGQIDSLAAGAARVGTSGEIEPDPTAARAYREVVPLYKQAYANLTDLFSALRRIRNKTRAGGR